MTRMRHRDEESGYEMNIGGSLMRQKEEDLPSDNGATCLDLNLLG